LLTKSAEESGISNVIVRITVSLDFKNNQKTQLTQCLPAAGRPTCKA
jgi:hypothetical protein